MTIAPHRYEESIGEHVYVIEVARVTKDLWRANLLRIPGSPTALMPFYAPTPEDAAHQLTDWLTRVHRHEVGGAIATKPGC